MSDMIHHRRPVLTATSLELHISDRKKQDVLACNYVLSTHHTRGKTIPRITSCPKTVSLGVDVIQTSRFLKETSGAPACNYRFLQNPQAHLAMTGQVVPCGSSTTPSLLNTEKNHSTSSSPAQPTLSPSSSSSSIHLIPNLVWSETISMDDQQQQQQLQHLKKVTLVPDPLAASVAAAVAEAAATSFNTSTTTTTTAASSTTTSSHSDRVTTSEGYSSASSHDNLPLNVARALLPPTAVASSTTESAATTAYAASLSSSTTNNNTVAEFLYQLTKMLSDDNRDIIEWSNGKIEVHSPQKLESQVLHKYFRHSKFASFQRQLNYFGFRKLAGKGKMAPCSYVNDDTTQELRSLLVIKRKASLTQSGKEKTKRKRDRSNSAFGSQGSTGNASNPNNNNSMVNPVLAGILQRSTSTLPLPTAVVAPILSAPILPPASNQTHPLKGSLIQDPLAPTSGSGGLHNMMTPQALAQAAVGKGIKHGLRAPIPAPIVPIHPPAAVTSIASTAMTTILPPPTTSSSSSSTSMITTTTSNVANVASLPVPSKPPTPPQQQPQQNSTSKGELLFLPDAQISHSIQESLSQLTNNFRNSLNELRDPSGDASGGESEQDGTRSMSPGGMGLFMLSRNSSLVDLAMLDVQNEDDDDDADGTSDNNRFLMPFVDFPHQDLIPSDQQQQQQTMQSEQQQQQQQAHDMSTNTLHFMSSFLLHQ